MNKDIDENKPGDQGDEQKNDLDQSNKDDSSQMFENASAPGDVDEVSDKDNEEVSEPVSQIVKDNSEASSSSEEEEQEVEEEE